MGTGKVLRLASWLKGKRTFVLAIDQTIPHGIHPSLLGKMDRWNSGPWDALVVHAGIVKAYTEDFAGGKPFLLKLTSNSNLCPDPTRRGLIASVEQALSLGAAGVVLNLFIGSKYEAEQLDQLAKTVDICDRWGMPVVVFANPSDDRWQFDLEKVTYACRIAAEVGADVVKTDYTGSVEGFRKVVEACPVPLLVEESPLPETIQGTLDTVNGAIIAGAAGVLLGHQIGRASCRERLYI